MKKYSPTTPSRRQMSGISFRGILTVREPEKKLTKGFKRVRGRNTFGRITTRHKGGGVKRLYREIDFKYDKKDIPAIIKTIEYDPNRSGFISLISYIDGEKRYVLLPSGLKVGDKVITSQNADIKPGNRLMLKNIPVGTFIYNIELRPGRVAKLARSAGTYAELSAHDKGFVLIKLPSGEIRKIHDNCWASIGQVSNEEHKLRIIGKAGRSRWLGIRPTVRGSAMNPVDHPLGGGEGRQSLGLKRPKNLWGKGIRGVKTRKRKKYSNIFIITRRKKK